MNDCFAFECFPKKREDWKTIINARSRGKAKSQYYRSVTECWEMDYRDIMCRKIGKPITNERFIHNAKYRGMPDIKCGQPVKVGEARGVIVGHNSSANFNVLFDDDSVKYAGLTLNVHPQDVELI
jgi:hypothetical protein